MIASKFVNTLLIYVLPDCPFFLQKIIPRITSRMTTNTDVTEPAIMEVFEGLISGVLAKMLVDVVLLVQWEIKIKDIAIQNNICI